MSVHPGVALYALDLLAALAPDVLPTSLPRLLAHRSRAVRLAALRWAEQLGLTAVAPVVRARLKAEGSLTVQGASLRTLAVLGDAEMLDEIIPYLARPEPELRQGALIGLLYSGDIAGILAAAETLNELIRSPRPSDRAFAAQALGEGGAANFYRPLARLLQDDHSHVQRAALIAAGKLKQPKLWPIVVQCLASPPVRSAAIDALVAGGETMLPALKNAFNQKADEENAPTRLRLLSLAKVCGRLAQREPFLKNATEISALLREKLTYPQAQVRGQLVIALARCGYRASAADQSMIHQQIEAEVRQIAWTLATLRDLGEAEVVTRLKMALQHSLAQQRVRLFGWLSLLYEAALIQQIQDALQLDNTAEQSGYAVEIIQLSFTPALKAMLLPLFEAHAPSEQLQRLNSAFPQLTLTPQERLQEIIGGPDEWLTPWLKVCALDAVAQLAAVELTEAVTKVLVAPERQVQHAAAWTLAKLAMLSATGKPAEEATPAQSERQSMLLLIEKVICLKAVDFLAESPEEVLADIAVLLEEKTSKAGEIILATGETDDAMFLIVDGQVRLHDGARTVTTLGENEVFNELMLLNPIPQLLTISAVTDTQLLRLPQAALRQVIEEQSALAWPIMQRLAQRVQRLQGQGRTEQARADLFGSLQEKLTRGQDDRMTRGQGDRMTG